MNGLGRISLRIAILTVLEPAGANLAIPRGLLEIGGMAVARHQLALALAMGAQRIVCVAREFSPGMVALQHAAERGGAQFHVISGARPLAGLINVADEIMLIGDGLMADPEPAMELLGKGACVLVQPVESGVAAGFERIDPVHASAGAARLPGRLAARLNELPADCDITSALTRIALQSGIGQRMVPAELRDGHSWALLRDENDAHRFEPVWLRRQLGTAEGHAPGDGLARLGVRSFGASLLHGGGGGKAVLIGAAALLLLALLAAWMGVPALAIGLLGLAWLLRRMASHLGRLERRALLLPKPSIDGDMLMGWLIDGLLVATVMLEQPEADLTSRLDAAFAPIMLLALLRILVPVVSRSLAAWLEDRLVLLLVLCAAAAVGWMLPVIKIAAAGLALLVAATPLVRARITRT